VRGKQLVAVLAVIVFLVPWAPTVGSAGLTERSQAIGQEKALQQQEQSAALTLLSLDEQLGAREAEASRIQAALPAAGQAVTTASVQLATARGQLTLDQKKLGQWLNFLYRYGNVSLVAEVLEAKSLNDFVSRLVFVSMLVENQAGLWQKARVQETVCARAVADLQKKKAALQQEEAGLNTAIGALQKEQQARDAFMVSLGQQSATLAQQVAAEEAGWVATLRPLTKVLGDLGNLPWDGMTPDSVSFGFDGVTAEFSDATLTGVLDSDGANLQLAATGSGVVISGAENGVPFALQASLTVMGPREVRLVPQELDLAGLPVQAATLAAVAGNNLVLSLPAEDPQWKLSAISTGAGHIDFLFGH